MNRYYFKKFILIFISILLFSCKENKKTEIKPILKKEKKKEKATNNKHKKGIEHIADYQVEIRKGINEEKSTYLKGNLITEYNKVKQKKIFNKSTSLITPIFQERGPVNVPGRTRGIAIDPTDSNRWFTGTVGGGVWLTEDAGVSWSNLTDFKIPNLATSTIVISPQDKNTLYVGTGEPFGNLGAIGGSGVFKTTDGGITWLHLTSTISFGDIGRIIINPADKNNVLVATEDGIYRTIDGGITWTQTYISTRRVQDLDSDPSDFNTQYGSVNSLGIIKSEDGGLTWSTVFDTSIINANHNRFETAVSEVNTSIVITCAYSGSGGTVSSNTDLYISRDSGATFTSLTAPVDVIEDRLDLVGGQGWYDNIVLTHPFDENVFYVGGVELFKVTINSDNTFTALEMAATQQNGNLIQKNTNVHVDQHGLAAIKGENNQFQLILANDGGVFLSNLDVDSGVNDGDWSDSVLGKNSTQFYGASKRNGSDDYLAGAQDNGSWISFRGNTSINSEYTLTRGGDGFKAIWHYNNPFDFLVTSQNNGLSRFIDFTGTAISGDISDNAPFYSKLDNANNNPDVVFTVTADGVWRSTDFGGNWNLTPITNNFIPDGSTSSSLNVRVSPADPNVVWAGSAMTESGAFTYHVSQDNGQTFSGVETFVPTIGSHNLFGSGMATSYIERKRAYLLFSSQGRAKIIKTEDLGVTWIDISGFTTGINTGFPDVAVHSLLEMPFNKDILWVGTDIGIFETEDGGVTWTLISDFPAVPVYDMKVVNDQVVIASYGRGIWSATIPELNTYTLSDYLAFPTVTTVQKGISSLQTIVTYNVTSDDVNRIKIFIDDVEQTEIVEDFSTDVSYNYETLDLVEGTHKLGIQLFDDTNNIETPINNQEFIVIDFKTPDSEIEIKEFESSDIFIYNESFNIDDSDMALSNLVLNNTGHPYENSTTYSVILKQPLILSDTNDSFIYEDVALVEPFTQDLTDLDNFFDFVIIEASTDLNTWVTLDKYDARRFSEWLTEFNKGQDASINNNLFKSQTISLSQKGFSKGDTLVFRFSLITDEGATSYGWAIKSINDVATASVEEVLFGTKFFTIYPTISDGNFTVFAKSELGKTKVVVYDIKGEQVYQNSTDFSLNERQKISLNLGSGIYIVDLIDKNNNKSSSKIIIE